MSKGILASDVIRSMFRSGFQREEIYDLLTGIGLPGEHVQLLIDRVAAEFHEAGMEPRTSRLSFEVEKVFRDSFQEMQHAVVSRIDSMSRQLEFAKTEITKLANRVSELRVAGSLASIRGGHLNRKSHLYKVGKHHGGKYKVGS